MPVAGVSGSFTIGPQPVRQTFGPYSEGAALTLSNVSVGQMDYESLPTGSGSLLTPAEAVSVKALVSGNQALPRWKSALSAVREGTRNARLMVISDSTAVGAFSASASAYAANNAAQSWPMQLAALMRSAGYAVNTDAVFGDQTGGSGLALMAAHDTRQTFGLDWSLGISTTGGNNIINTVLNSVQPRTFTPSAPFDTIELQYLANAVYGTAILSVDGVTPLGAPINQATGGSVRVKTTRTVPLGNYTVSFRRDGATGAASINATCIRTYNSNVRTVDLLNVSVGGATPLTQSGTGSYFSPLAYNADPNMYAPDLVIICLDINNWIAGYAAGTYDAVTATTHNFQIQAIMNAFLPTADVILMTGAPSDVSRATFANQLATAQGTCVLAAANNVPLVDVYRGWGSWLRGNAAGYFATGDTVHPGAAGYANIASLTSTVPGIFG
jgi:lysophospholipase L1-like esterase